MRVVMDGCMDGWTGGWADAFRLIPTCLPTYLPTIQCYCVHNGVMVVCMESLIFFTCSSFSFHGMEC